MCLALAQFDCLIRKWHTLLCVAQEFLKRIPSATALSNHDDSKPNLFGSTSTNSLLNLAGEAGQGMKHVASLDMLRTLYETQRDPRAAESIAQLQSQYGAIPSPQPTQLFQAPSAQGATAPSNGSLPPPGASQQGACLLAAGCPPISTQSSPKRDCDAVWCRNVKLCVAASGTWQCGAACHCCVLTCAMTTT